MIHHIEFNGFHGEIHATIRGPAADRDGNILISPGQAARLNGLACPSAGECQCGEKWATEEEWARDDGTRQSYVHTGVTRGSYPQD